MNHFEQSLSTLKMIAELKTDAIITEDIKKDLISGVQLFETLLDFHKRITELPDCNDCAITGSCPVKPELGQQTRINCPIHVKKTALSREYHSRFAFDSRSRFWNYNEKYNVLFISAFEREYNDLFQKCGRVLTSDVCISLGIRAENLPICGWDKKYGDKYVDFGPKKQDNGTYILDFNDHILESKLMEDK